MLPETDFINRHIGPRKAETKKMLDVMGLTNINKLINKTIPKNIRLKKDLDIGDPMSEARYLEHIQKLGRKNKTYRSYIGLGYYNNILPGVIQRNIFENPGWYTAYTPYQAEISQGRLESQYNFQELVKSLTHLPLSNASLLDKTSSKSEKYKTSEKMEI